MPQHHLCHQDQPCDNDFFGFTEQNHCHRRYHYHQYYNRQRLYRRLDQLCHCRCSLHNHF